MRGTHPYSLINFHFSIFHPRTHESFHHDTQSQVLAATSATSYRFSNDIILASQLGDAVIGLGLVDVF